jgi:predicted nucleic acid-binding protein
VIVADASLLFPYVFETETTAQALRIRAQDPDWRFPRLWRQEFSSALLKYVRAGLCSPAMADQALAKALELYASHEVEVSDKLALRVARHYGLSANDALYVTLAQELGTVLLTGDRALVRKCGGLVVEMR